MGEKETQEVIASAKILDGIITEAQYKIAKISLNGARGEFNFVFDSILEKFRDDKIDFQKTTDLISQSAYLIYASAVQSISQDARNEELEKLGLLEAFAQYYQDKEESNREDHRGE